MWMLDKLNGYANSFFVLLSPDPYLHAHIPMKNVLSISAKFMIIYIFFLNSPIAKGIDF